MTKLEYYTDRSAEAYRIAKNVVQTRRERAGITGCVMQTLKWSTA